MTRYTSGPVPPFDPPTTQDATASAFLFGVLIFVAGAAVSSVCMGGLALGVLAAKALGL